MSQIKVLVKLKILAKLFYEPIKILKFLDDPLCKNYISLPVNFSHINGFIHLCSGPFSNSPFDRMTIYAVYKFRRQYVPNLPTCIHMMTHR